MPEIPGLRKLIGVNYPALLSQLAPDEILVLKIEQGLKVTYREVADSRDYDRCFEWYYGSHEISGVYAKSLNLFEVPRERWTYSALPIDDKDSIHRPVEVLVLTAVTLGIPVRDFLV